MQHKIMQHVRWSIFAAALCLSTWMSIIRIDNLEAARLNNVVPSCDRTAAAPAIHKVTTQPTLNSEAFRSISLNKTAQHEIKETASLKDTMQHKAKEIGKPLPPVHINSTWIGNQWIPPPGYRLYSTREIQSYFQQHSILWIGDSTARRTFGTMYGILNATEDPDDVEIDELDHPRVIDVNKMSVDLVIAHPEDCHKQGYSLCRRLPHDKTKLYDIADATCLQGLVNMTENQSSQFWRDLPNYSLVIYSIGPWELRDRCGLDQGWETRVDRFLNALYDKVETMNATFIWRTWGNVDFDIQRKAKLSWKKAYMYNEYMKKKMDEHEQERKAQRTSLSAVSYIDWGQVMFPRSFPRSKRIRGDLMAHYGLEARLTFIQMLMNHLVERDRQKELTRMYDRI